MRNVGRPRPAAVVVLQPVAALAAAQPAPRPDFGVRNRTLDRRPLPCYYLGIRNTKSAERFGVSMEPQLLAAFDAAVAAAGHQCRSEAVRDLVRLWLAARAVRAGRGAAVGVLSFVYDHDRHDLSHRLTRLQHEHHAEIVTSVHVHLDHATCLEVVILRGRAGRLRRIGDRLIALKSVQQGNLTLLSEPTSRREVRR